MRYQQTKRERFALWAILIAFVASTGFGASNRSCCCTVLGNAINPSSAVESSHNCCALPVDYSRTAVDETCATGSCCSVKTDVADGGGQDDSVVTLDPCHCQPAQPQSLFAITSDRKLADVLVASDTFALPAALPLSPEVSIDATVAADVSATSASEQCALECSWQE